MTLGFLFYLMVFVIAGALIRRRRLTNGPDVSDPTVREPILPAEWPVPSASRLLLMSAPALGSIIVWTASRNRALDAGHGDIAVLWLITIALANLAVSWPVQRPALARFPAWVRIYRYVLTAVAALTVAALFIRTVALDRYTWLYSSDEGAFGIRAVDVLNGKLKNPFATSWFSHPTMWFFLQAQFMRLFGDGVAGTRVLSAVMGTATIPVTYLYVRRHMGIPTALTAAALVGVFHVHVFWSRNALNNISSAFFVVLVLWLLDRVIDEWRPRDALLAGLAIGISQFGYASNHLLFALPLVYLAYAVIAALPRTREALEVVGYKVLSRGVLIAAGAFLGMLPLAAYYVDHAEESKSRMREVSIFAAGWLE
ncbi:MAG: glycosyltransferase family 39 protein [Thermomicrobiales bacterium]